MTNENEVEINLQMMIPVLEEENDYLTELNEKPLPFSSRRKPYFNEKYASGLQKKIESGELKKNYESRRKAQMAKIIVRYQESE